MPAGGALQPGRRVSFAGGSGATNGEKKMNTSKKQQEAKAMAAFTATFSAHSLILHLLFNMLADSGPAAGRARFKLQFRKFAHDQMRDFIAAAEPEERQTFEETAFAEIDNILSDRESVN
jgi:hypothetical protein